ncbi:TPA: RDD family protein [Legionella pneumophila]|nr:RDD family protein [Legionella pneumophila]
MFFIKYSGALIYDLIIVSILFFAYTSALLLFTHGQAIPPATRWYQLSLFSIAFVYYYGSIRCGGQTVGMKAWKFKLTTESGKKLSRQQIIARFFYFIPATLIAPFCLKGSYVLLHQWTQTRFKKV